MAGGLRAGVAVPVKYYCTSLQRHRTIASGGESPWGPARTGHKESAPPPFEKREPHRGVVPRVGSLPGEAAWRAILVSASLLIFLVAAEATLGVIPGVPSQPPAAPTPKPSPTPTPDPRLGLAPGPVVSYVINVRTVNNGERDALPDSEGRWVVHAGERVDFDSTQRNANGEICRWNTDPLWYVDGVNIPMETLSGPFAGVAAVSRSF